MKYNNSKSQLATYLGSSKQLND